MHEFWKSVKPCGAGDVLDKCISDSILKRKRHTEINSRLGDYQPKSWFRKKYNRATANRIVKNCKDIYECPLLGTCYRVPILGGGQIDRTDQDRSWAVTGTTSRAPAPKPPEIEPTTRAKPPADDSKAKEALLKKGKADAQKSITKLASIEISLSTVLSSPAGKKLAAESKKRAKDALKDVEKIMNDAKQALMGKPFPHKADAVKVAMERATAQVQVLELIISSNC